MGAFATSSIPSVVFVSLLGALALAALATALAAIYRVARNAIRARRARRALLPDDWWTEFEREFRGYAVRQITRDARRHE